MHTVQCAHVHTCYVEMSLLHVLYRNFLTVKRVERFYNKEPERVQCNIFLHHSGLFVEFVNFRLPIRLVLFAVKPLNF